MDTTQLKALCLCPLSGCLMTDPYVLNQTGVSYQKEAITHHVSVHGTDPATGAALFFHGTTPNRIFQRFVLANAHLLAREEGLDRAKAPAMAAL